MGFTTFPRQAPYDLTAVKDSRFLDVIDHVVHIGDKGHTPAPGLITPIKKPVDRELHDSEKEFNKKINTIRYIIEQTHCAIENLAHPPPTTAALTQPSQPPSTPSSESYSPTPHE